MAATALFWAVFVSILLATVSVRGGGNLLSRVVLWQMLQDSLHHTTPELAAMDDPVAHLKAIESFLLPSEENAELARAHYDRCVAGRGAVSGMQIGVPEYEDARELSVMVPFMFRVPRGQQWDQRTVETRWVKTDGVWYIERLPIY